LEFELGLIAEFDVPVGEIDEVLPALVMRAGEREIDERPPLRPLWFAQKAYFFLASSGLPSTSSFVAAW
jgi:hypothetical protein